LKPERAFSLTGSSQQSIIKSCGLKQ
jgi:hypothetical protein